jgi:secreted trypsin-like serine protease
MGKAIWALLLSATLTTALGFADKLLAQETIKLGGRRIVGGEKTDIKDHPWQVALNIKTPEGTFLCGGSIIAQKWVLTAAHCIEPGTKSGNVRAKAGATNYTSGGNWTQIERILVHDKYNPETHENDLALLKLSSPPSGKVIPLAQAQLTVPIGQRLEVTGWGVTSEGGDAERNLMKASVPYVDNNACNAAEAYNGSIRAGMLCAGRRDGGVDACQGDSGGPLVWKTEDGPILVGVVSFGEGCARKLKYGVYTRVSKYREWITKTMAAN